MKERITLTIEKDILTKVDDSIDGIDIKNRSHAIELLITKAFGQNKPSKAVILAGGKKKRIISQELKTVPKPMIRIKDKPILEYNIELLKKYDVKDIIISLGYKGEYIKEYFGNGSQFGVNITYVEEEEPLGTGGPLHMLKDQLTETFIVLNGDELKDIDIEDIFVFHKRNKGMTTIALTTVEDPSEYGVALMNGNKIMTFMEKPNKNNAPSKLINAGLYVMEPEVLKMLPMGYSKIENEIFPKLAGEDKLLGYVFSGQWFDARTEELLAEAKSRWEGIR